MHPFKQLAAISVLLLVSGCQRQPLLVETEYVSFRSLASHWVQTPDPNRLCPSTGQRIFVSWRLPQSYLADPDLHIDLVVRFGDNSEDHRTIPVTTFIGTYTYSALNDAYWNRSGIRTYRAQLISSGCILEQWRHQLWADLIEFTPPDDSVNWLD